MTVASETAKIDKGPRLDICWNTDHSEYGLDRITGFVAIVINPCFNRVGRPIAAECLAAFSVDGVNFNDRSRHHRRPWCGARERQTRSMP